MFLHFHLSSNIFAFFLPRFRNYINANSFWNKKISISQHIHRRLQLSERKSCKSAVDYFQIQSRYIFTIKSLYNNELKQNTKHLLTLNSECFSLNCKTLTSYPLMVFPLSFPILPPFLNSIDSQILHRILLCLEYV